MAKSGRPKFQEKKVVINVLRSGRTPEEVVADAAKKLLQECPELKLKIVESNPDCKARFAILDKINEGDGWMAISYITRLEVGRERPIYEYEER